MRIILIDNHIGYICGDSTGHCGRAYTLYDGFTDKPDHSLDVDEAAFSTAYAEALDMIFGNDGRSYTWRNNSENVVRGEAGYRAYRADVGGSEYFALINSGQYDDDDVLEAIERDCRYLGFIAINEGESSNQGELPLLRPAYGPAQEAIRLRIKGL